LAGEEKRGRDEEEEYEELGDWMIWGFHIEVSLNTKIGKKGEA
jgi:hypothetical protein